MEELYYLEIEKKYFVDAHGSADYCGSKKFVGVGDIPEGYSWGTEHIVKDKGDRKYYPVFDMWGSYEGSYDGYNKELETVTYKLITKQKYEHYKHILDEYEKI